jgi:hypothetical protein
VPLLLDFGVLPGIFGMMASELLGFGVLVIIGAIAGFFSGRLPMSAKLAFGLSLLPALGFGVARVFC